MFLKTSIVRRFNAVILSVISLGLISFALLISYNNYNQIIEELNNKTVGTIGLARIAFEDPLYNYDDAVMESIITAILLDSDIIALRITDQKDEPFKQQRRAFAEGMEFENIKTLPNTMYKAADIVKGEERLGRVEIVSSTQKAYELIRQTSILIGIFALALLVTMGITVALVATRVMKVPIVRLEESAAELAKGNLEQEIDTRRLDELGRLARSFANMRDSIRKKMADLRVLNNTGEKLAGMHNQTEALQIALSVMQTQFKVEWGSIYLLNEEKRLIINAYYPQRDDVRTTTPRSFDLGQGVAGQTASTKEIVFIPDTEQDENYLPDENESPQALLCIPMMDDQSVFGVMNFSGVVGEVAFTEEDSEFALTIARMTVVTIKNIQMLNVIEEQNRTLEQKVEERTMELRQKTNDINNMLQNMHQGIFTIVEGNKVHPEYSMFVESILEDKNIAERDVIDMLFSNSALGADALNGIKEALIAMIGEDAMTFEFNGHHLVKEYQKIMVDSRVKILEVDWDPIIDPDTDTIEKLMVTLRDVTDLRGLQAEAEHQKQELEIIGQILSVSQSKFQEFLKNANQYISENETLIRGTDEKNQDTLATLFRNMHTIKGNARTYGFKYLTDAVHETEQTYDWLRKNDSAEWDAKRLLNELEETQLHINRYENVYRNKLGGGGDKDGIFVDKALLQKIQTALAEADSSSGETLGRTVESIGSIVGAFGTEELSDVVGGILKALPSLAEELDKKTPVVDIQDNGIRFLPDSGQVLKDVFMHVFRNSMDHGLETTAERLAAGKPAEGKITVQVSEQDGNIHFKFFDDGRGLNLDRIKAKALEKGVLAADSNPTAEDIANLIFNSGLSTAENVTKVSGRGVGMDAVKEFLRSQGGEIQISALGDGANDGTGYMPFALDIQLPGDVAIVLH